MYINKQLMITQVYILVYNQFDRCFYIHHDIVLPSYPLCVEWLDYDSTNDKTNEPGVQFKMI